MRTGIIIQARTGSTRLPNKMVMPFFEGKTILEILIDRIKKAIGDIDIILATSTASGDDKLAKLAAEKGIMIYRGSEADVLGRFIGAAETYRIDRIIRICGDNPFLSMRYLKELIDNLSKKDEDYISFITNEGIPSIKTHFGLWTEAITLDALKRIAKLTEEKLYHEHVTNYSYEHPDLFSLFFIPIPSFILESKFRLTVDTIDDFNNARNLYEKLLEKGCEIEVENIIPYLDENILDSMKKQIEMNSK